MNQEQKIFINIPDEETKRLFYPYVSRKYRRSDPKWLVSTVRFKLNILYSGWKKSLKQIVNLKPKVLNDNPARVDKYENIWQEQRIDTILSPNFRFRPTEWRSEVYQANPTGIKRIHLLYLMRVMEIIRPKSVLEVGFGNGINLLTLSACFPEITFTGIEVTKQGLYEASSVQKEEILPGAIKSFSPMPVIDNTAHRKINFLQGDARNIQFDDNSFDLVFTVQALEQMNDIRDEAMADISRVSKRYVAMVEAFRDWNNKGFRRIYIRRTNYFQGSIAELARYKLKPVYFNYNIPSKIKMRVGLVVCKLKAMTALIFKELVCIDSLCHVL